jgi:cytoskeletal protein CcmA (bactofilin family)
MVLGRSGKEQEMARPEQRPRPTAASDTSVISKDMRIVGDCETDGRLRIEGRVTGNVSAGGLEVAASGSVEGDITAREGNGRTQAIIIDGRVEGAVRADRVEVRLGGTVSGGVFADEAVIHGKVRQGILARTRLVLEETAAVEGDVRARRLALKEGGQVNGNIRMGDQAAADLAKDAAATGRSTSSGTATKASGGGQIGGTGADQSSSGDSEAAIPAGAASSGAASSGAAKSVAKERAKTG